MNKEEFTIDNLIVYAIVIILLMGIGCSLIYFNPTNIMLVLMGFAFVVLSVFMFCWIGWNITQPPRGMKREEYNTSRAVSKGKV